MILIINATLALGFLCLVLIINQNIWRETFEDNIDDAIKLKYQKRLFKQGNPPGRWPGTMASPSCHSSVSRSRSPVYSSQLPMITLFTHLKVVPRSHYIESSLAVCVVYGNAFQQCTSPVLSIKDEKGSWFHWQWLERK